MTSSGPLDDPTPKPTADFTLVLAGGGVRGFAHAGVLRALEAEGYRPNAIVGVSMGAVVAAAYAFHSRWYERLVTMDTGDFAVAALERDRGERLLHRLRSGASNARVMWRLMRGWGSGERATPAARDFLKRLTGGHDLEDGRLPIAVCATDLRTGDRVVMDHGSAADAVYASAALAGVMPPLEQDGRLLCDGAYTDLAPIDVARRFDPSIVIAVDPVQELADRPIRTGFHALTRAVEICHLRHADLRFQEADMVLHPRFRRPIDVLEFDAKRECIAAGTHAVRGRRTDLARLMRRSDHEA